MLNENCFLDTFRGHNIRPIGKMCVLIINLIKTLLDPCHKLHDLLPPKVCEIRNRETRLSGQKFYNFNCRTQRFKNSPIVYGIEQYNKV